MPAIHDLAQVWLPPINSYLPFNSIACPPTDFNIQPDIFFTLTLPRTSTVSLETTLPLCHLLAVFYTACTGKSTHVVSLRRPSSADSASPLLNRTLLYFGIAATASCSLLANAEIHVKGRAGLAPRAEPTPHPASTTISLPPAAALGNTVGGPSPVRKLGKRDLQDGDTEAEVAEGDGEEEGGGDGVDGKPPADDDAGEEHKAKHGGEATDGDTAQVEPSVNPGAAPMNNFGLSNFVESDPAEKEEEDKSAAPTTKEGNGGDAKPTGNVRPMHHEAGNGESPEDCDEEPATVYVTVTVDEYGNPAGPAPTGDSGKWTGSGGGGGEDHGECIEGCYEGDPGAPPVEDDPTPEGDDAAPVDEEEPAEDEDPVLPDEEEYPEEEPEEYPEEEIEEPEDLEDDDAAAGVIPSPTDDSWDDPDEYEQASPSASETAADFESDGSTNARVNALPVLLALALCSFTSLAAGLIFT